MGCMMMMGCGGMGAAAFSPSDISGLALWLDATRGLYQERTGASATTPASADGDPVGTWLDYSGNARHATAPSDAARPTLKLAIQNGKQVARFDGAGDSLASPSFALSTAMTVFYVANPVVYPVAFPCPFYRGVLNADFIFVYLNSTPTKQIMSRYVVGTEITETGTTPAPASVILSSRHSGGGSPSFQFWKNGVSQGAATPSALITASAAWTLSDPAVNYARDDVCEVLVYDSALSDAGRGLVETYLNDKWAIY